MLRWSINILSISIRNTFLNRKLTHCLAKNRLYDLIIDQKQVWIRLQIVEGWRFLTRTCSLGIDHLNDNHRNNRLNEWPKRFTRLIYIDRYFPQNNNIATENEKQKLASQCEWAWLFEANSNVSRVSHPLISWHNRQNYGIANHRWWLLLSHSGGRASNYCGDGRVTAGRVWNATVTRARIYRAIFALFGANCVASTASLVSHPQRPWILKKQKSLSRRS